MLVDQKAPIGRAVAPQGLVNKIGSSARGIRASSFFFYSNCQAMNQQFWCSGGRAGRGLQSFSSAVAFNDFTHHFVSF